MTFFQPDPVILVGTDGQPYSASGGGAGAAGSIKGSGASAQTTDSSQVVALSPNTPLPAGSNALGSVSVTGTPSVSITGTPSVTVGSSALPTGAATDATFSQVVNTATLSALNALVAYTPGRKGTTVVQVTGTFVATLSLLGSVDNTNYVTFGATPQFLNLNTGAYTATITAPGIYQTSSNGLVGAQIKATAYTSGSAVVTLSNTDGPAMFALDASIPAGSNTIGTVTLGTGSNAIGAITGTGGAVATKASGTSAATTDISLVVTQSPNSVAAASGSLVNLASTTNGTSIKASAGTLFEIDIFNGTAATIYTKLYNKASAPTVGTDIPVLVIPTPSGGATVTEFGAYGKRFTTGIAYAVTTSLSDSDSTAITVATATPAKLGLTYL